VELQRLRAKCIVKPVQSRTVAGTDGGTKAGTVSQQNSVRKHGHRKLLASQRVPEL
jgi:hypothetical protein